MTVDTTVGMLFSNIIAYFIILATASTLHAHGINQIQTAAQAAEALRPIAGGLAFWRENSEGLSDDEEYDVDDLVVFLVGHDPEEEE